MTKRRIGIIVVLLALAGAGYCLWAWKFKTKPAPEFTTATVERGNLKMSALVTGTVQPQNRLEIKSPISGRIQSVEVREGAIVKRGQVLAWMSSTERAALLDAARAQGPEELARWEQLYKAAPLVAPLGGIIIARNVEPGQTITTSDAVLVMSDRLIVKAQVDETDLARIRLNMPAEISLDAYPSELIPSTVDHIAYEAKTVNNVTIYEVEVLPKARAEAMRSGMTANVSFIVANKENVLLIPTEAIRTEDGKSTVRVPAQNPKKRSERRDITVGLSDGKRTEVMEGLSEGDTVLISNVNFGSKQNKKNPFMPQRTGAPRRMQ
jgi:membrane fusion protein, macrolide-specific efflux system